MPTSSSGLCMGCMSPLGDYIVCPHCGYDNGTPYDKQYRKPGSILGGRYIVGRLVRKNGEGAVYVGYDNNLQVRVWVREYFPHTIAERHPVTGDIVPTQGRGAQFKALLSDFIDVCNEVKRMGVTEPVVPIENVVADHGTAYAIYKDIQAIQLEAWLNAQGGKLPVAEARSLLLPLFNTLSNIHARGVIHRGISPYTVYIDENGKLYLWDFCMSATRTGGSELEAELYSGYSAPEQYIASGWQGTWTDVYGAAALFYRVVSGFVPPRSTMVSDQRPLAPLIDLVMDMPPNISDAVAEAMNPVAEQRTQEIGAFVSKLVHTSLASTAVYDVNAVNEVKKTRQLKREEREEKRRQGKYVALGLLITVVVLIAGAYIAVTALFPELFPGQSVSTSAPGNAEASSEPEEGEDSSGEESSEEEDLSLPDFLGQKADEVQAAYKDRYRFSIEEEYNNEYEEGVIYQQAPYPGTTVLEGRTVKLYVSKGKLIITMPDLVGMTIDEAAEALWKIAEGEPDLPFTSYNKFVAGSDVEPGQIVSTTPPAGAEFNPADTRISVFIQMENPVSEASQVDRDGSESSGGSRGNSGESSRITADEFASQWNR